MRIMFLISSLQSGGAERVISTLTKEFIEHGDVVALSTFASKQDDFFALPDQVIRYELGGLEETKSIHRALFCNCLRIWRIHKATEDFQPDVLIAFLPETNVLAVLATLLGARKVVVCERNLRNHKNLPMLWRVLRKITYPRASAITANSTEMKKFLEHAIKRPVIYLENPIRLPEKVRTHQPKGKVILSVGRLSEQKNFDLLIRSFCESKYHKAGWSLIIIGEGTERQSLAKLIADLGIVDQVRLMGLSRSIDTYLREASLFVLTSRYEGTPNAALEAMASGVPVMATETCGEMQNILINRFNGLLVPANESLIREEMDWACENPNELVKLGKEGSLSVKKFEKTQVARKWREFLVSVK